MIQEVLAKLPDEHAIRAIELDREAGAEAAVAAPPETAVAAPPETGGDDAPSAA